MRRFLTIALLLYATNVGAQTSLRQSPCPPVPLEPTDICWNGAANLWQFASGGVWVNQAGGTGGPPTGAAGGDLSGSYPNPGVAKINGVAAGPLATQAVPCTVAQGCTGATAAGATAANNIGAAAKGANSDITSLTGLTTPLSAAQGGSGVASPTAHSLLLGEGSSAFGTLLPATNQVIIGVTSADPKLQTLSTCSDSTHAVGFNASTNLFTCQAITATAAPGGSTGSIQYNNAGALGGIQITGPVQGNGTSAPSAMTALTLPEATAPSGVASSDILYPDTTAHRWKMNNNNGTATQVVASGADINTSDQVTATHLAAALPVAQGGTATTTFTAGIVRGNGTAALTGSELSGDATTSGSNVTTVGKVNGVSYGTSPSTDTAPVVTAANATTYTAISNCVDSAGNHLNYSTATHTFSCGSSSSGAISAFSTAMVATVAMVNYGGL